MSSNALQSRAFPLEQKKFIGCFNLTKSLFMLKALLQALGINNA
jgi:hypothetical protein